MMQILNFASKCVRVPDEHLSAGVVRPTVDYGDPRLKILS
jgi:hypothetical protein